MPQDNEVCCSSYVEHHIINITTKNTTLCEPHNVSNERIVYYLLPFRLITVLTT